MSDSQRRCLDDASAGPLTMFRRGFSRDKMGPFHERRTVQALISSGALRMIREPHGKRRVFVKIVETARKGVENGIEE
jgi:hypothetical protein